MLEDLFSLNQVFLRIRNPEFKLFFLQDHAIGNRFSIIVGQRGGGKTTAMT